METKIIGENKKIEKAEGKRKWVSFFFIYINKNVIMCKPASNPKNNSTIIKDLIQICDFFLKYSFLFKKQIFMAKPSLPHKNK